MNIKCYICKIVITPLNAYKDKSRKNGLMTKCKKCHNTRINLKRKGEFYRHKSSTQNGRYKTYSRGARVRNYEFSISKEDFMKFWQKDCYYCGDSIKTIGLDRIDNNQGYVINNLVSCCTKCNVMKMQMSKEEFIHQCHKIITNLKS